jgi:hypothetical protein
LGIEPKSSIFTYSVSAEAGSNQASVTNIDDGNSVYQDTQQLANGVVLLRAAKQGAATYVDAVKNSRTPAKDLMMSRWNPTCAVRAENARRSVFFGISSWLENEYSGGPTEYKFAFGALDGEPSFPSIISRFDQLLASATEGRELLAQNLVADLNAIVANPQLDLRPRAVASYDCAVVYLVIGNLEKAHAAALAALALNEKETDGFFGSSGKDLAAQIKALSSHINDRRSRSRLSP